MELICFSVNYHNTPVELRECISLPEDIIQSAFAIAPIHANEYSPISEMVILSTCNRLEVYAVISLAENSLQAAVENSEALFQPLLEYLHGEFHIPTGRIAPFLRRYTGSQAVEHLCLVTAGLDSIAIGETQILGQVSRALDTALHAGSARHILSSLFRMAIQTGKRVRTETEIGRHPTSISDIAVLLGQQTLGGFPEQKILVVGAGKMGSYTLEALRLHGAQQVQLTSRNYSHATEAAARFNAAVLPYERLLHGLAEADLVFTSTASPLPVIDRGMLIEVMRCRPERGLALIDLAVPRNVEPAARAIPGVQVFDMDDLQSFARSAIVSSHQDIARAEAIVTEEVTEFEKLLRIAPFLGELHKKVEEIRQREVEKTLRHLPEVDLEISQQIEMLSRSLVRKILHEPTMHLRSESNQESLQDYVSTLAKLFDLQRVDPNFSLEDGVKWER